MSAEVPGAAGKAYRSHGLMRPSARSAALSKWRDTDESLLHFLGGSCVGLCRRARSLFPFVAEPGLGPGPGRRRRSWTAARTAAPATAAALTPEATPRPRGHPLPPAPPP